MEHSGKTKMLLQVGKGDHTVLPCENAFLKSLAVTLIHVFRQPIVSAQD